MVYFARSPRLASSAATQFAIAPFVAFAAPRPRRSPPKRRERSKWQRLPFSLPRAPVFGELHVEAGGRLGERYTLGPVNRINLGITRIPMLRHPLLTLPRDQAPDSADRRPPRTRFRSAGYQKRRPANGHCGAGLRGVTGRRPVGQAAPPI